MRDTACSSPLLPGASEDYRYSSAAGPAEGRCNKGRYVLALCLLLMSLQQMGSAGYIRAKAHLAQWLIGQSWERSLASAGEPEKPWPWADTWPVARLEIPELSENLYVLWGSTGNALAFGPGYEIASAKFGEPGVSVIGGHRDTHFAFLRQMEEGVAFRLQLATGEQLDYRVREVRVVDSEREPLPGAPSQSSEILLVTCYPFDALLPGGPLRYVVSAYPVLGSE